MTGGSRRRTAAGSIAGFGVVGGLATAFVIVAVVAAAAWWFVARTTPDRVGPRFVQALIDRRPGTTADHWDAGFLRVTLASGVYIDVRLSAVFDACEARRFHCTDAIDRALDDVDLADRATREPRRDLVRALVIGESTPGLRYGFVTDPLIGSLEVRYALVTGVASTSVTGAVLDRLGLTQTQLREVAIAALTSARDVTLSPVDGEDASVRRVRSGDDDAVALLLDGERMKRFATELGATRLYVAVPGRGLLYLAPGRPDGGRALAALLARRRGPGPRAGDAGLLAWDTAAPDRSALSSVPAP